MKKQSARKRHSEEEIARKLARAGQLESEGKTQAEIAKTLGITVMTYHRWRKMHGGHANSANPTLAPSNGAKEGKQNLRELKEENARLRDIIVRMVLKKDLLSV